MKHLRQMPPIQQVFILVFTTMIFYQFMTRLPFPETVFDFSFTKLVKIICGLAFSLGVLFIYILHKKANHGSGR
ncbi:hypothetical protein WJR50_04575 [Catalinimonas sp. 4WD22]|uniref:hypothetical protein n=1 Tax=Catalinimonas locisalis TaxID=3133978 RepID=UPI0031015BC8